MQTELTIRIESAAARAIGVLPPSVQSFSRLSPALLNPRLSHDPVPGASEVFPTAAEDAVPSHDATSGPVDGPG